MEFLAHSADCLRGLTLERVPCGHQIVNDFSKRFDFIALDMEFLAHSAGF
jgi:hypothetical protein